MQSAYILVVIPIFFAVLNIKSNNFLIPRMNILSQVLQSRHSSFLKGWVWLMLLGSNFLLRTCFHHGKIKNKSTVWYWRNIAPNCNLLLFYFEHCQLIYSPSRALHFQLAMFQWHFFAFWSSFVIPHCMLFCPHPLSYTAVAVSLTLARLEDRSLSHFLTIQNFKAMITHFRI